VLSLPLLSTSRSVVALFLVDRHDAKLQPSGMNVDCFNNECGGFPKKYRHVDWIKRSPEWRAAPV
jgi:hypothetical protein